MEHYQFLKFNIECWKNVPYKNFINLKITLPAIRGRKVGECGLSDVTVVKIFQKKGGGRGGGKDYHQSEGFFEVISLSRQYRIPSVKLTSKVACTGLAKLLANSCANCNNKHINIWRGALNGEGATCPLVYMPAESDFDPLLLPQLHFCCQCICTVTRHRAYVWFMALLLAVLHNLHTRTSGAACKCKAFIRV